MRHGSGPPRVLLIPKGAQVAWYSLLVFFCSMLWLLGYLVMGLLSFPLESEFTRGVTNLVGYFVDQAFMRKSGLGTRS